uniref:Uncharacterized protein n=2 Tax=Anguilla anguilla TaxID=7936 RepID=A0A0E9T0D0_ANGAN
MGMGMDLEKSIKKLKNENLWWIMIMRQQIPQVRKILSIG